MDDFNKIENHLLFSVDCRTAKIGSNWYQNSITIQFDEEYKCPKNVDKSNWLGGSNDRDKFSVTQTSSSLTVRRTDRNGEYTNSHWGMELKFWCCKGNFIQ